MKDNATLEDVISALINKGYFIYDFDNNDKYVFFRTNIHSFDWINWQLNKPFSEQLEETKQTLNKIL